MMNALVLYWSQTGNTEKVAHALVEGLERGGAEVTLTPIERTTDIDLTAYDLVCLGFPSYRWSPPKPVDDFLNRLFAKYRRQGWVQLGAPARSEARALIVCTYSGPHTGIREAIPAGAYAGQFFEHLGIPVVDEWYVVGEFHGREDASTQGRLGDIRGRPNAEDLDRIRKDAEALLDS
jgi:multimeric flavodoxin WrbA